MTEPINEPKRRPKLSVVIPVYNEADTIQEILRRVAAVRIDKEIVVVDDFSTDGTRDVLRQLEMGGGRLPARHRAGMQVLRVATCECSIRIEIRAKARLCGAALRKRGEK